MALKYTIFNPSGATLAIEEYGGGAGGYAFQWRGYGPTFCTHLIVSLMLEDWAHTAGGLMDHLSERDTYRMVWHTGARWKGATDPARAESVLRWLGECAPDAFVPVLFDTFMPDRAQMHQEGLPVPGFDRPGTARWYWHMGTVVTPCAALDGRVMLATSQAMPMEESYRWTKDLEFMARECRAMAKAALQLRENRHVPK